jgi:hypothetical protein
MKASHYKKLRAIGPDGQQVMARGQQYFTHPSSRLYNVGINADGSLHNPYGYPEDIVRSSIADRERVRANGVLCGVKTRAHRREDQIWQAVKLWRKGELTPARECRCCHKDLTDPPSIARGIGPECWPRVLGWDRKVAEKLFAEGIDRDAMLTKVAEVRAGLTKHAETLIHNRFTKLCDERLKRFRYSPHHFWDDPPRLVAGAGEEPIHVARLPTDEEVEKERPRIIRFAEYDAKDEHARQLRALDRIEEELGRGSFGAKSLHELDEIDRIVGAVDGGHGGGPDVVLAVQPPEKPPLRTV